MRWRLMRSEVVVVFHVKRCPKQVTNVALFIISNGCNFEAKDLTQKIRLSQPSSFSFSSCTTVLFFFFASFPRWTFVLDRLLINNAVFAAASTISLNSFFEI